MEKKLLNRKRGQTFVEYALLLVLVAVAAYAGFQTVANDVNSATASVDQALGGAGA